MMTAHITRRKPMDGRSLPSHELRGHTPTAFQRMQCKLGMVGAKMG